MKRFVYLALFGVIAIGISMYMFGNFALGTLAQETEADAAEPNTIDESEPPIDDSGENEADETIGDVTQTNEDDIEEANDDTTDEEEVNENATDEEEVDADVIPVDVPIKGTEEYYKGVTVMEDIDDPLILVNKSHVITSEDVPSDLEKLPFFAPGRLDEVQYLRKDPAAAIVEFCNAAESEAELKILPASAYRSYDLQTIIFSNNIERKGSIDKANETSALPGQSEHQTGLAVDVTCEEVNYQIRSAFGDTEEGKWTAENAHRFGFIIRYPEGKTDITGYNYEPWHLRYVGKDIAKYIYENDITYEEYYEEFLQD